MNAWGSAPGVVSQFAERRGMILRACLLILQDLLRVFGHRAIEILGDLPEADVVLESEWVGEPGTEKKLAEHAVRTSPDFQRFLEGRHREPLMDAPASAPFLLLSIHRTEDERCFKVRPGESASPDFLGEPEVLEEGLKEKQLTPLARPLRWRLKRRGSQCIHCSTFVATPEEAERTFGRWGHFVSDEPWVKITIETDVSETLKDPQTHETLPEAYWRATALVEMVVARALGTD